MNSKKIYRCFAVKLFDTWRIMFYSFLLLAFILEFVLHHLSMAFGVSGIISFLFAILHILSSYTVVELNERQLKVQTIWEVFHLKRIGRLKTWWCYDYGISSIELGEGSHGEARQLSNKINCFIKFTGENEELFLYEQIHLSDKFPNNHKFLSSEKINKSLMVRIWDVDKCLNKLGLEKNIRLKPSI